MLYGLVNRSVFPCLRLIPLIHTVFELLVCGNYFISVILTFTIYIMFSNFTVNSLDLTTKVLHSEILNLFPCKKTSKVLVHDNTKLYID